MEHSAADSTLTLGNPRNLESKELKNDDSKCGSNSLHRSAQKISVNSSCLDVGGNISSTAGFHGLFPSSGSTGAVAMFRRLEEVKDVNEFSNANLRESEGTMWAHSISSQFDGLKCWPQNPTEPRKIARPKARRTCPLRLPTTWQSSKLLFLISPRAYSYNLT